MKKTIYSLGILALTAFSFASCQKELTPEKNREGKLVTVTFVAESTNTKSGVATEGSTSVSYKWTTDDVDNMKLFTVGEDSDGKEVLTEVTDAVVTKVSDTKLTITATLTEESVVRAFLSKEQTSGGAPRIMATQSPLSDSFDPVADILISEDETVSSSMPEEGLIFHRQVVINKMTLHNLVEGEKVKKVILTSNKGLNGYWDLETSKMVANSNGGKKLTLLYDDVVVSSSKTFPVYFVTIPNAEHTLGIEVQTDQNIYSKTIESTTLDFNLGEFTKFNVGLPVGTPATGFEGGNYAIGNPDGTKIAVLWKSGDNNLKSIDVTEDSEGNLVCAPNVEIKNSIFTFAESTDENYPGMFTIQDHNELYLYAAASGSNHLMAKSSLDANCYWDISQNADGSYSIVASKSSNRNVMQNNGSIFSCYASASQTAIVLYPDENVINDDTPLIEVTSENPIGVPAEGGSYTIQYILYNEISGEKIVFDPDVDWITDPEILDDEITFVVEAQEPGAPARSAEITLGYEGAESVVITVNQEAGEGSATDYSTLETSNVTLIPGTNGSSAKVDNEDAIKVGTSSKGGDMSVTVPAGTTELHVHAAAWKGVTGLSLNITGASVTPSSIALTADDGITSNSPFTLSGSPADYYFIINLSGITEETTLKFASSSEKRFVVWGVNAVVGEAIDAVDVEEQSFTFSEMGYANQADVAVLPGTSHCTITFDKGTGANGPKYYTSGTAVRAYAGNTITVKAASGYKISTITISFGSSDGSNTITASDGTYNNGLWTGSIENGASVVFSIGGTSGNRRISAIKIN